MALVDRSSHFALSDTESGSAGSDLDERIHVPPPDFNESTDEEVSDNNYEENQWEEFDKNRHRLKNHQCSDFFFGTFMIPY